MLLAILVSLVAIGVLTLLYAWLVERNWFALRRHRVPCLPPGTAPIRILHVSDLHFRRNLRGMRRFVERRLQATKPDLVVGTGDFLGDVESSEECAAMLGAIPARLGGVFVLGSNDYYAPVPKSPLKYFRKHRPHRYPRGAANTWEALVAALETRGWRLMRNRVATLDGIEVAGFDDPHIERHDLTVASPRTGAGFRLAVVHSPDIARDLARLGYDLIVAGHTHGGQLRVPGYGAIVTNTRNLPRRMARGLHRLDGAWLHVSAGMGTSKYAPVRFACRPEACLLELVPTSAAASAP